MATSPATIRSVVRTHLAAAADGWTESPGVPELLGSDPRVLLAQGYSVAVPDTTPQSDRQGRGGVHLGTVAVSTVVVRWTYRLPVDDQRAGYDDALSAEQSLCRLVCATPSGDQISLRFVGASRTPSADGSHVLGTLTYSCLHTYDLTAE